jgi:molecular chaperone DnaJ
MSTNYYDILGVEKNASQEDIKKAFRKKALEHHPDKGGDQDLFIKINEANEVLSDEEKRKQYDRYGSVNNGRQQAHGFNMDDIFSQFEGMFNGGHGRHVRRGEDLKVQVMVDLNDAMFGCIKKVKYKRHKPCVPCNGKGGTGIKNCTVCNGSGKRNITQNSQFGVINHVVPCNNCQASGKIVENACKTCKGVGTILSEEVLDITLPKGIGSGMRMCMDGQGNHVRDGQPGDLYIFIEETKHSKFNREGFNLYCEEWISIPDAVLGTDININTLLGDVPIKIAPGCESGKTFTISGKGVPILHNNGQHGGNGNLYVKVNVTIPKTINKEEKELYTKLRKN